MQYDDAAAEELLRGLTVRRIGRVIMYFLLTGAGVMTTLYPSDIVKAQVGGNVVVAWSVAMTISAAICLYGAITDRWIGEYTALPLLGSVLGLYGFSVILASDSDSLPRFAFGLIVLSYASGLAARWKDVREIKKANYHAVTRRNKGV